MPPSLSRWISRRLARHIVPANLLTRADLEPIVHELKTMNETLARLVRRESQLRAVLSREAELDHQLARLSSIISKPGTAEHVADAIARAPLHDWPFPHAVVDDLLPRDLYQSLLKGLPPLELFADRPENKQQLAVPFRLAPRYSQRVWRYFASVAVPEFIVPAVSAKFRPPVDDWIAQNWPTVAPESVRFHSSDGRILLRRRGYRIPPHRDPKWGFVTCILYLARPDDSEAWGTQLFTVDGDGDARGAAPHWIDAARCTKVGDVTFRPNRMLVFLNSVGAHAAEIPPDAKPDALERYIYQFRIAPTTESMSMLKAALPDEQRALWAGKDVDY
jgi:hypothetical protein